MLKPIKLADALRAEQEDIDRRAHEAEVSAALFKAHTAISEYYNGDRAWAESWLLAAMKANEK